MRIVNIRGFIENVNQKKAGIKRNLKYLKNPVPSKCERYRSIEKKRRKAIIRKWPIGRISITDCPNAHGRHMQSSLEGNRENSYNINRNMTALDEYVLGSPNIVVLSTSGINARASIADATVDFDVILSRRIHRKCMAWTFTRIFGFYLS